MKRSWLKQRGGAKFRPRLDKSQYKASIRNINIMNMLGLREQLCPPLKYINNNRPHPSSPERKETSRVGQRATDPRQRRERELSLTLTVLLSLSYTKTKVHSFGKHGDANKSVASVQASCTIQKKAAALESHQSFTRSGSRTVIRWPLYLRLQERRPWDHHLKHSGTSICTSGTIILRYSIFVATC